MSRAKRPAGILANVSWTSLEQVLRMAVSFLITIQVVNYLGPDRFGLYSYTTSIVGILSPLTTLGLEQVVIRHLVERPEARDRILGTTFAIRLACGVVGYLAGLGIVLVLDPGNGLRLRLIAVGGTMLLVQGFDTAAYFFKANLRAQYVSVPRIAGLAALMAATLALLFRHAGLEAFLWVRAVEAAVAGVAMFVGYRLWGAAALAWRIDGGELAGLLKAGFPLFLASFSVMIYMRIDQVMLGQMVSAQELGYYGVAVRLAEVMNFVPVTVVTYLYPSLIAARQSGQAAFDARVLRLFKLMAFMGYGVAGIATVAAPLAFRLLFHGRYDPAVPTFIVLSWSLVFICLGVAKDSTMTILGRFWTTALTTGLGMATNIGLNFWLIPRFGGYGAAWATLISYWFAVHAACVFVPWLRPFFALMTRAMILPDFWTRPRTT